MREFNDFVDVTLACEDGHEVDAHKLILAGVGRYSLIDLLFLLNVVIIKMNIIFEQLPNFPFLRCNYPLPLSIDGLVNIG